jgi:hypothetical protein
MMFVSLTGGLGNQLFQYFAGLSFTKDDEACFLTPSLGVPRRTEQVPDLEYFSLHETAQILEISSVGRATRKAANLALTKNLRGNEKQLNPVSEALYTFALPTYFSVRLRKRVSVFTSDDVGYTSKVPKDNSIIFGYFQTYKYYASLSPEKKLLKLKSESKAFTALKSKAIEDRPLVVHVRLGDYLLEEHFGVLTKDYYRVGLSHLDNQRSSVKIWLFSDNPSMALEMMPSEVRSNIFVVPKNVLNTAETLELMRYGTRYLIANSSFSWWGAMLSFSEIPKVVAPSKWFKGMRDPNEIFPENWELLAR